MGNSQTSANDLTKKVQKVASELSARLFRNNTGSGWVGSKIKRVGNTMVITDPRPLEAGLVVGSSDLIGWTPITITPEMVGSRIAVFTAIEIKTPKDRTSEAQRNFIDQVVLAGGIAKVVRKEAEVEAIIPEFLNRARLPVRNLFHKPPYDHAI